MMRDELKSRLGVADELQIRLLVRLSPARRLQTMLEMQAIWLDTVHARLRHLHPELPDLELTRLMFARLKQNGWRICIPFGAQLDCIFHHRVCALPRLMYN